MWFYLHWAHGFKYFVIYTQKTSHVTEYHSDMACVIEYTSRFGFTFWLPYCTEFEVLMPSPTDCSYCSVLSVYTWKCNLLLSSQGVRQQVTNNGCPVWAATGAPCLWLIGKISTSVLCVVLKNVIHIATSWNVDSEADFWKLPCHAKWPKNYRNWAEMRTSDQKITICGRAFDFFLYCTCSVFTLHVFNYFSLGKNTYRSTV